MNLSFAMRVTARPDVLIQELDGQAVLLHLDGGRYFGLDEVGTRMWQVLAESPSIQAAYERLLAEFEVEPEQLRQDLEEWITELTRQGLVEVSGE
jgi:hypothetical protein